MRLIRTAGVGSGAARNVGVAEATGDVLAFTDADCFPSTTWLAAVAERIAAGADVVVGAVAPDPAATMGPFDRSVWVERETGLYETANLTLRRELFERVGGFQRWLADAGAPRGWTNPELGEDVPGWRARRAGARVHFCPEALVHHAVHGAAPPGTWASDAAFATSRRWPPACPSCAEQFLFARWFLSRRTAAFDASLLGLAAAAVTRWRAPLLAALPYLPMSANRVKPFRGRAPYVAAVDVVADPVGFASLVQGSAVAHPGALGGPAEVEVVADRLGLGPSPLRRTARR